MNYLKFSLGNAKLHKKTAILSIPAGWSCPFAKECLSKADKKTGKLKDGKHSEYRCYAASEEARYPSARYNRWNNFNLLRKYKNSDDIARLIIDSMYYRKVDKYTLIRLHASGDFFNEAYFLGWMKVAKHFPDKTFYAYTKSLRYWIKNINAVPDNFKLIASKDKFNKETIEKYGLRFSEVVFSYEEAENKGLRIDKDDSIAFATDESFALLIHGIQPKRTKASEAWNKLKKQGKSGYGNKKMKKAA